jgi:hypothetical protein
MVKFRAQPPPSVLKPRPVSEEIEIRLGVHDLTRLEWVASAGLPGARGERKYEIEFTVEIPAHVYTVHNVWDHKQTFTRLQSPSEDGELQIDRIDLDELRRDTLGVAHRLKTLQDRFQRTCAGAAGQLTEALHPQLEANLSDLVVTAVEVVWEMRQHLHRPASTFVPDEVQREWSLADEFLSHKLLDFLGKTQRQVDDVLMAPSSRLLELDACWVEELRCLVAEGLSEELVHRRSRGYLNPRADAPIELSRFLERASQLKKHFQDVLFLDVEAYMVDYKLRNWTGIMAATLAAAFWLGFTLLPIGPGAKAGIGLGAFGVAFAASYALKDRIKELTRGWLAGRLVRLYGQRSVTLRLPPRIDPQRKVLMEARETFDCLSQSGDDVLNRTVGRTQKVMALTFRMKAEVHGSAVLEKAGIHSIKHVFRYDVSPLFSRLDDAVKSVPVFDASARSVRFVQAPKEYRFPVRVIAYRAGAQPHVVAGMLVLSKRGIERLEPIDTQA